MWVCVGLLLEYEMTGKIVWCRLISTTLFDVISVDPCEDDILLQWQMEQDRKLEIVKDGGMNEA
jgi:hypothetical protein